MLTEKDFLQRIFEGVPLPGAGSAAPAMVDGFDAFEDEPAEAIAEDGSFARRLLESSGFGPAETLPTTEVILGGDPAARSLPPRVYFWGKSGGRPYQTLLFELDCGGLALLEDTLFREERKQRQLEDAVHRLIQYVLVGFEKGGEGRTADVRKGPQSETLVIVSVRDDREGGDRHLVCFGTRCVATSAMEVFTLREEARDWDRPLAEEHLRQLFQRHFKKLGDGEKWQDAFVSGKERAQARKLMDECSRLLPDAKQIEDAVRTLLDEIAGSFGVKRKEVAGGKQRLPTYALPENHGIGVSPQAALKKGFKNPLKGFRVFDAEERLLGYIVYVVDKKADADKLREQIRANNHFHNVLVVYPDQAGATLELWQGTTPLQGRLVGGARQSRFDGEGGVVQLLSRFIVVSKSPIATPSHLATELAWRAQHLKELAKEELRVEVGRNEQPLRKLHEIFNKALATLDEDGFADAYAQTITYGLLAARWLSKGSDKRFTRTGVADLLPSTSPFLHDLFKKLVNAKFSNNLEWLLDDLASLLSRTMVREVFAGEKDPSIHFYQDFLDAYDPQIRKDRGVYYTPDEVVSYIVRTAHTALQDPERFGLRLGLADTMSWGEFAKARGISVPKGVDPKEPFVQVLDPATGTGTFILRVIEVIHETMQEEYARLGYDEKKSKTEWVKYVRAHLLPRVNAFELMMAPYIVSHLRLGLALQQTGFTFGEKDRLRVFLTNAMLAPHTVDTASPLFRELLAAETEEADRTKDAPISVVVGNPPYSKISRNRGAFAESLVEPYKALVRGERNVQPLSDDYLKFLALAVRALQHRPGVIGLITNRTMVDGLIHRGVRVSLESAFSYISVTDLHGDTNVGEMTPTGVQNENVFNITQGVAISHLVRTRPTAADATAKVTYAEVWGTKPQKLRALSMEEFEHHEVSNPLPLRLWIRVYGQATPEYENFPSLETSVRVMGMGIKSRRDHFLTAISRSELVNRIRRVADAADLESLRSDVQVEDNEQWSLAGFRGLLRSVGVEEGIYPIEYRPFDRRFIWYDRRAIERGDARWPVMKHLLGGGLSLIVSRQTKGRLPDAAFVARGLSEMKTAEYSRGSYVIPLWLEHESDAPAVVGTEGDLLRANFRHELLTSWAAAVGVAAPGHQDVLDLFHYTYAILNAPGYRERYSDHLRRDFPRLPLPARAELGVSLARIGADLVALHLLDEHYVHASWNGPAKRVSSPFTRSRCAFAGSSGEVVAGYPKFKGGRVLISPTAGFSPVSESAWSYTIGGYEVLDKWLKARRGQVLSAEDREHVCRVIASIEGTLLAQSQADEAVAAAGGWEAAFRGGR